MSFVDIPGATSNTYTLQEADVACDIRCVVTAVNAAGNSLPTPSNSVGLINERTTALAEPVGIASKEAFGTPRVRTTVFTQTVSPQGIQSATAFGVATRSGGARAGEGGGAIAGTDATISDGNLYDSLVIDGDLYGVVAEDGALFIARVDDTLAIT